MECQLPPTCSHTPMVKGLCQQQRLVAPVVPLQVAHLLLCPQLPHLTALDALHFYYKFENKGNFGYELHIALES